MGKNRNETPYMNKKHSHYYFVSVWLKEKAEGKAYYVFLNVHAKLPSAVYFQTFVVDRKHLELPRRLTSASSDTVANLNFSGKNVM